MLRRLPDFLVAEIVGYLPLPHRLINREWNRLMVLSVFLAIRCMVDATSIHGLDSILCKHGQYTTWLSLDFRKGAAIDYSQHNVRETIAHRDRTKAHNEEVLLGRLVHYLPNIRHISLGSATRPQLHTLARLVSRAVSLRLEAAAPADADALFRSIGSGRIRWLVLVEGVGRRNIGIPLDWHGLESIHYRQVSQAHAVEIGIDAKAKFLKSLSFSSVGCGISATLAFDRDSRIAWAGLAGNLEDTVKALLLFPWVEFFTHPSGPAIRAHELRIEKTPRLLPHTAKISQLVAQIETDRVCLRHTQLRLDRRFLSNCRWLLIEDYAPCPLNSPASISAAFPNLRELRLHCPFDASPSSASFPRLETIEVGRACGKDFWCTLIPACPRLRHVRSQFPSLVRQELQAAFPCIVVSS